ncbi:MAG TPA: hypothetical protein PLP42_11430, partial [Acidobacteriota bacterium]|nr:hypothetical protein [Acidobacteriota bacterium]
MTLLIDPCVNAFGTENLLGHLGPSTQIVNPPEVLNRGVSRLDFLPYLRIDRSQAILRESALGIGAPKVFQESFGRFSDSVLVHVNVDDRGRILDQNRRPRDNVFILLSGLLPDQYLVFIGDGYVPNPLSKVVIDSRAPLSM